MANKQNIDKTPACCECVAVCVCGCFTRRLAKSTLLLIPLFGMNYMLFVYLVEPPNKNMNRIKIFFDLGLGSFQVACVSFLVLAVSSACSPGHQVQTGSIIKGLTRLFGRGHKVEKGGKTFQHLLMSRCCC